MATAVPREAFPLSWPDDWMRTRQQDRKPQRAWKKPANHYRAALLTELARMGSPSAVISRSYRTRGSRPRLPSARRCGP